MRRTLLTLVSLLAGIGLLIPELQSQLELKSFFWNGESRAEIINGDFAQARTQVLENAFKQALTQALTEALGEKLFQEKAQVIEKTFFQQPSRFVARYKIISQNVGDKEYLMQVEVELSQEQIQMTLKQVGLISAPDKVLMLAVLQEKDTAWESAWLVNSNKESLAEKILATKIQSWGYQLAQPKPILDPEKLEKELLDPNWLTRLKTKTSAELLIAGRLRVRTELKAKAEEITQELRNIDDTDEAGKDRYSAKASLELTVIDLNQVGRKLNLQAEQTAQGPGKEQAINQAVELVVYMVLPELNQALERLSKKQEGSGAGQELLEVTGLLSYYQYQQLWSSLKKADLFQKIELWGFAPGTVRFLISYNGNRETLKKAIANLRFPEFRLLPVESDSQALRFKFESL